ncbi:hypothetical protein P9112_012379 [Eukaryota sp. TZLM1-RC]
MTDVSPPSPHRDEVPEESKDIAAEARFAEEVDKAFSTSLAHVQDACPVYICGEDANHGYPILVIDLSRCECTPDDLFLYLLRQVSAISHRQYAILLLNSDSMSGIRLSHAELKGFYQSLPRSVKKSIVKLFVLRPSFFSRFVMFFLRPFVSSKFLQKYHPVMQLHHLDEFLSPARLQLPLSTLQSIAGSSPSAVFVAMPDDIPPERLALVPELPVLKAYPPEGTAVHPSLLVCFERIVRAESLRTEFLFRSSHAPELVDSAILWLSLHSGEPIPSRFSPTLVASVTKKIIANLPFSLVRLESESDLVELTELLEEENELISKISNYVEPVASGTLGAFLTVLAEVERFRDCNQMTFSDLAFCVATLIIPPPSGGQLTKAHVNKAKDIVLVLLTRHIEVLQVLGVQVAVLDGNFLVKASEEEISIPHEVLVSKSPGLGDVHEENVTTVHKVSEEHGKEEQLSFSQLKDIMQRKLDEEPKATENEVIEEENPSEEPSIVEEEPKSIENEVIEEQKPSKEPSIVEEEPKTIENEVIEEENPSEEPSIVEEEPKTIENEVIEEQKPSEEPSIVEEDPKTIENEVIEEQKPSEEPSIVEEDPKTIENEVIEEQKPSEEPSIVEEEPKTTENEVIEEQKPSEEPSIVEEEPKTTENEVIEEQKPSEEPSIVEDDPKTIENEVIEEQKPSEEPSIVEDDPKTIENEVIEEQKPSEEPSIVEEDPKTIENEVIEEQKPSEEPSIVEEDPKTIENEVIEEQKPSEEPSIVEEDPKTIENEVIEEQKPSEEPSIVEEDPKTTEKEEDTTVSDSDSSYSTTEDEYQGSEHTKSDVEKEDNNSEKAPNLPAVPRDTIPKPSANRGGGNRGRGKNRKRRGKGKGRR